MRYLGIDYGSKRTGIAISDENGKIAFPREVLPTDKDLLKKIGEICVKEKVGAIVLGQSLDYKNQPNVIQEEISKFKTQVTKRTNLDVYYESEVLTSALASRNTRKGMLDASAAALILQSYLDRI